MKITILSIGKFRNLDPCKELFLEYQKRLNWKIELKELELKGNIQGEALKIKEGELLISKVASGSKIIALDEKGKIFSSEEFATVIKNYGNQGNSDLTFIIGGADGLSAQLKQKADLILSFSKMTFPHLMIRSFLIEQIYRANTIISGHPYHRQ
jgi:23S rRNA (pseudouridine1915-N3)-methyltransferase